MIEALTKPDKSEVETAVFSVTIREEVPLEGNARNVNCFVLYNPEGEVAGAFALSWNRPVREYANGKKVKIMPYGTFSVRHISIDESLRGYNDADGNRTPGIGRDLYRQIATRSPLPDRMTDDSLPYHLVSGQLVTDASRGMWEGFVARGEAQRLDDGTYVYNHPNMLGHSEEVPDSTVEAQTTAAERVNVDNSVGSMAVGQTLTRQ